MSVGSATTERDTPIHALGRTVIQTVLFAGDVALFGLEMLRWLVTRLPRRNAIMSMMFQVGVGSLPVVIVTGGFIGMVLAVQAFDQFRLMGLESRLGSVINVTLVKELAPVLAAMMLAGRVGSAMSAELGTMKVTEQIDALRALGANPIHYLVVPRFLACLVMIPLLTIVADTVGMLAGWGLSTQVLGIDSHYYWYHSFNYIVAWDVMDGIVKSICFGAAIALISCHRGFNSRAGAEGVGRAATEAFVLSFIAILVLDFFLGMLSAALYYMLWPEPITLAHLTTICGGTC